jgi:lysophospholipase L1-like esterase
MNFMIPNLKTTMYFNGYVWEHHTDALGFRNRQITVPSDIVLLGDSMVYGHGLNFDETLGHYLALQTGLTVTNLARQGDCFFQYAYLLTEYAPLFRPRHVLVFFTENDINDLYGYLSDEELIRFADTPITEIRYPQRLSLEASLEYRSNQNRPFSQALGRSLYVARIADWLAFRRALTKSQESMMSPTRSVYDPSSIAWRYSRKALMYMQDASSKHGSQLTLVTLPAHDTKLCGVIHGVARELGVPLLDACELRDPNPSWFLTGDGHFSATGTKAMAAIVARSLGR